MTEDISAVSEITRAMTELIEQFGQKPWYFTSRLETDDFGMRIEVHVDDAKFNASEDTIPRDYKNFGVVVLRRPCPPYPKN